ncbi:MAG: hypothetical protein WB988_21800 [Candidatus Nitrosopolaris sp.]
MLQRLKCNTTVRYAAIFLSPYHPQKDAVFYFETGLGLQLVRQSESDE